ncbi:hypothetical protein FPSE_08095 [Fusarium pseudograminearum CS3096]|uniref:NACHT domain-containing protein n=1 Tax=Fusarium pseudograminearum (strain CS3096) TaxID=1028729 RepID=K3VD29_FUSPC|nr:hypothetical protein FPSE_08095 [Fusarium pseudograminearum CS3096]EKJ71649.1 hypothetical protein FPSE_08095 [Fusarium pseudograminearum CS3096]
MSGFEALGMACAVFQTISFAQETTRLCVDIYRGLKMPDSIFQANASSMIEAAVRVKASCKAATTPEEKCLIDVAKECTSAAAELSDEVRKITELHKKGKGNIISAARGGVTSFWKKNKMNSLDNSLRRHAETMQTLLITRVCDQNEAGRLKQRQDFETLDEDLQVFIKSIAKGHKRIELLLQDEGETTREHVTNEATRTVNSVSSHIMTQAEKRETTEALSANRQSFLKSFRFQEMNERVNAVTDPEDVCFDRVLQSFEKTAHDRIVNSSRNAESTTRLERSFAEADPLWNSFADWLQSDGQLFWIQGKPGSGKSTLVKYVASKKVTQTLLKEWNPNTRILSHFFWKIGTSLQNDIKGLYCSLLHQLLEGKDGLTSSIMDFFPSSKSKKSYHDWSVPELNSLLLRVLELATDHENLCIFIDGLDEFVSDSGQDAIITFMSDLKRFTKVKVCVTSRPELWLKEELDTAPNLKLHDLTAPDMRKWVHERLQQFETVFTFSRHFFSDLVKQLLKKAGGVFLWIRLATQSVIRGIKNKDSEEMLISRLEQLPEKLEDLYYDMWKRLGEDEPLYRKSAATYLRLMVGFKTMMEDADIQYCPAFGALHIIKMVFATRTDIQRTLTMFTDDTDYKMVNSLCETTTNQIHTNCAGLLEVHPPSYPSDDHDPVPKMNGTVEFVHRTAYDFIVGTEAGQKIISYSGMSDCEVEVLLYYSGLYWQRILYPVHKLRMSTLHLVKGLPRLLGLKGPEDNIQKIEGLCCAIRTFYDNEFLASGLGRWPRPPFASILATVRPIFDWEVEHMDPDSATSVLQNIPWHKLKWDESNDIPVSGLRRLLSQGADPDAAVSYAALYPITEVQHGKRTAALWEFLYHTQWVMWQNNSQNRTTQPHVVEIAAEMLQRSSSVDQHGLLVHEKMFSGKPRTQRFFYSLKIEEEENIFDAWIRCILSANVSYLLDSMLRFLPQQEKAKMHDQVQFIESKIVDPTICLRVLVTDDDGVLQCFQIIDQHPFQGLIDTINEQERNHQRPRRFGQCKDEMASLIEAKRAMVEIESKYVRRTFVEQGLLGTYEIEDDGLEYSPELLREIEDRTGLFSYNAS